MATTAQIKQTITFCLGGNFGFLAKTAAEILLNVACFYVHLTKLKGIRHICWYFVNAVISFTRHQIGMIKIMDHVICLCNIVFLVILPSFYSFKMVWKLCTPDPGPKFYRTPTSDQFSLMYCSIFVQVIQKSHSVCITSAKEGPHIQLNVTPERTFGLDSHSVSEPASHGLNSQVATAPESGAGDAMASMPNFASNINSVTSHEERDIPRQSPLEMNADSSESDSPRETPVNPAVDLPSVNFENLLEAKETDILNDSFHSDSSLDTQGSTHHHHKHSRHVHGSSSHHSISSQSSYQSHHRSHSGTINSFAQPIPTSGSVDDLISENLTIISPEQLERNNGYINDHMSDSVSDIGSSTSDVQIHVEDTESKPIDVDSDKTPTQEEGIITKVYANTEVRLRNKKKQSSLESPQSESPSKQVEHVVCQTQENLQTVPPSQRPPGKMSPEASPIWKRKSQALNGVLPEDAKRMSNISEASEPESVEDRSSGGDYTGIGLGERLSSSASSDATSMGSGSDHPAAGSNSYRQSMPSSSSVSSQHKEMPTHATTTSTLPKMSSRQHKRLYRIGLNLFNK